LLFHARDTAVEAARIEFYPQPTNGVTYIDVRSDFAALTAAE